MKKTLSIIICIVTIIAACSNFSFALAADTVSALDPANLDYDALLERAFVINSNWEIADLQNGNTVDFYFRGKRITESYVNTRHFNNFNAAYNRYLSQNPDILTDVPVFIFAPGTYNSLITVRYSAIILGANAGINPNGEQEWTVDAMADGVPANSERTEETVFTAGLTRTTRSSDNDAKWSYDLEQKENAAGKKADIKFIVDGVKITGAVGISQYDYSNRLYTDLTLDGNAIEYTPTGTRTTTTALVNSVVDNFSGTGANALFSARCNSMNKNDAVLYNVRLTNISSSATFLFNKYFRNLTIDGMYYANNANHIFGSQTTGSTFCGNTSAKTAEYNQNIEIKNSVFYKNTAINPISIGNASVGDGYTKTTANIHHNFFYDAVYGDASKNYWGIFLVNSALSNVDYTVNVTDNIIHQENTTIQTLFNGNQSLQKSKTTINFNRNKVTGDILTIYPNTSWNSSYSELISTSFYYDFSNNFHSFYPTDIASRPIWDLPPQTDLANGYDYTTAPYYLDYDLTISSVDFEIQSITGLGDDVQIDGLDITADCTDMSGILTPQIIVNEGTEIQISKDINFTSTIDSINLSEIEKGAYYFVKYTNGDFSVLGSLLITTGKYSDINSLEELDISKFNLPVISVDTDDVPIVDKENYVDCGVSISNTDSDYCMADTVAGIRFRGNSTLLYSDKKAYRIKFDKKQNLFDMGKAKSWVLLANSFDKTMVRNTIAFAIGGQLDLEYTSLFQYVNLYLNGEYMGLYLLCEQTQTGSTRVDVEEDESGKVDTGYLIEMAGNGDPDEDRCFSIDPVPENELANGVSANWRDIIKGYLKTPELDYCTDEQVAFISEYVNNVNYAILTQDWESFNELCDVESFVKYFVVNTVLNNADAGFQLYTYKKEDGGKLYAGPIWDFDQSSASGTHGGDTYNKWYSGTVHPWFDSFSNWNEFLKLAKRIYLENHQAIEDIINYYTFDFYPQNAYDFHANDVRWNNIESDYWRISETIKGLKSYSENFTHLNTWFNNRITWLDKAYSKTTILPDSILLDKQTLSITKNTQYTFTVTAQPIYSDEFELNWISSAPDIASVDNGVVTAHSEGTAIITATAVGTDVSASCTVSVLAETITPDNRLPQVVLNEAGNGVITDMRGSWATRVYWGNIGEEFVEYKWFDEDFRLLCGTNYFADYAPRNEKVYNFTKPGYYRFVLKNIINPNADPSEYKYKEVEYTFYYDGKAVPTVPTITELGNNQVRINTNGTAIKKFYYGNIGQTNVPYSWFNSFWGKALETKTYQPVFDNRDERIITLQTKGYYNIVIVTADNTEYIYTVYADVDAPIIKKADNKAVVDIDILNGNVGTKATITKFYYGYIGTEDKEINSYDQLKENSISFSSLSAVQGTSITLKNYGYYKFLAVVNLYNGKTVEFMYTIENK